MHGMNYSQAIVLIRYLFHEQVNDSYLTTITYTIFKEADGLETIKSKLEVYAKTKLFKEGKMRLKCLANQYDLYSESVELEVEDDTPQLAHVLSPSSMPSLG